MEPVAWHVQRPTGMCCETLDLILERYRMALFLQPRQDYLVICLETLEYSPQLELFLVGEQGLVIPDARHPRCRLYLVQQVFVPDVRDQKRTRRIELRYPGFAEHPLMIA